MFKLHFHPFTRIFVFFLAVSIFSFYSISLNAMAAAPVVHAVLFFSPSCGHCHIVMSDVLPPLHEKYGEQFDILAVDIQTEEGQRLFKAAVGKHNLTQAGVPLLLIGETYLMGSVDIPNKLPGMVEAGVSGSGINWPALAGLDAYRQALLPEAEKDEAADSTSSIALPGVVTAPGSEPLPASEWDDFEEMGWIERASANFRNDLAGNYIAVVVLVGMLFSIGSIGLTFINVEDPIHLRGLIGFKWPVWTIPVLCIAGLGVAGYLSYVELSGVQAVCGPVGNCNAVQESPYATLWGVIPVGVFGMLGYTGILGAWILKQFTRTNSIKKISSIGIWGMALIGVFFSIYLTFLEPFVIGATCAWCIASAILITLLLWVSSRPALAALHE
jgi:uncharacterized membrane protein